MVRSWNRLPREVVDTLFLEGPSTPHWMGPWATWSSTRSGGWWPCLWQGDWNLMILGIPSIPSHSVILWSWEQYLSGDQCFLVISDCRSLPWSHLQLLKKSNWRSLLTVLICDFMLLYLLILRGIVMYLNPSEWQPFFILVRTVCRRIRSSLCHGNCLLTCL